LVRRYFVVRSRITEVDRTMTRMTRYEPTITMRINVAGEPSRGPRPPFPADRSSKNDTASGCTRIAATMAAVATMSVRRIWTRSNLSDGFPSQMTVSVRRPPSCGASPTAAIRTGPVAGA
jgi:hypothetical protein